MILFLIFLLVSHISVAFLDVSADALAIETSKFEERGKINGAMFTGLFGGMLISAPILGYIAHNFSYNTAFIIAGFIILGILIFPIFVKEASIKRTKRPKVGKQLLLEYKKRPVQLISLFAPVTSISGGIIMFAMPLYMNEVLKLNIAQIGLLNMVFPLGIIVGANVGGIFADSIGRKTSLYAILIASIFVYAALIFVSSWETVAIVYGAVGICFGAFHSISSAILMDITNPEIGATQYGLFTSLFNAGEMGGEFATGTLIVLVGFTRLFLYAAILFWPGIIILHFIRYKDA